MIETVIGTLIGAVLLGIFFAPVFALIDILRTDRVEWIGVGSSRSAWIAIVLLTWSIGAAIYFFTIRRKVHGT